MGIQIYDRDQKKLISEKVYGARYIDLFYKKESLRRILSKRLVQETGSKIIGIWQHSALSRRAIGSFVRSYNVNMDDYIVPAGGFRSFNDFFIRRYKEGVRRFPEEPKELGALAEGRLSVFSIGGDHLPLVIKGVDLSLGTLLGSKDLVSDYIGGLALVFRLCPVDYHRYHFFDEGRAGDSFLLEGALHSVNPVALQAVPDLYLYNERRICAMETLNFGRVLMMEIGAFGVGRIMQSYQPNTLIKRGQEKGYFSFGGSTCVLILPPKPELRIDEDILTANKGGHEVYVHLGERIGCLA